MKALDGQRFDPRGPRFDKMTRALSRRTCSRDFRPDDIRHSPRRPQSRKGPRSLLSRSPKASRSPPEESPLGSGPPRPDGFPGGAVRQPLDDFPRGQARTRPLLPPCHAYYSYNPQTARGLTRPGVAVPGLGRPGSSALTPMRPMIPSKKAYFCRV